MLAVLGVLVVCGLITAAFFLGCYAMTRTAWEFEDQRDIAISDLRLANQRIRELEALLERPATKGPEVELHYGVGM